MGDPSVATASSRVVADQPEWVFRRAEASPGRESLGLVATYLELVSPVRADLPTEIASAEPARELATACLARAGRVAEPALLATVQAPVLESAVLVEAAERAVLE
jgi:hypothetical protein